MSAVWVFVIVLAFLSIVVVGLVMAIADRGFNHAEDLTAHRRDWTAPDPTAPGAESRATLASDERDR